ncbi:hypothetical protein DWB85_06380 [Seongchinamella sediminis]|uniref:Uncharacterized protein n=1 Tax=Seongchinamella sediminis TaxID=2283635 RepID=A0A3L7DYC5_9GAMM|nr:hypothetical protein [Seongchinamella sediminis]RLQ22607.1 hypothetical protein DWB85_06380 [Seongchinamella sediminis]
MQSIILPDPWTAAGDQARYVQIGGNGPNALDFHIAFYAGQIVERFTNLGHARPRKVATLKNTIITLFLNKLDDAELTGLVEHMRQKDLIVIDKEKISYKPPISQP